MLQSAIFDMDGLLVDSEPLWRRAEIQVFNELLALRVTEADCARTMGMRIDHVVSHWMQQHPRPGVRAEQVADAVVDRVCSLIESEARAMPGVEQVLALLAARGLRLGLASSSPLRLIECVLSRLDLARVFQVVHSAEFEARGKPDPAVFLTTARKLGAAPQHCLVFEDSIAGVQAGLAANMCVVAVPAAEQRNDVRYRGAALQLASLLEFGEDTLDALTWPG